MKLHPPKPSGLPLAAALLLALAAGAGQAQDAPDAPRAAASPPARAASSHQPARSSPSRRAPPAARAESGPTWSELTPAQQQALQPLVASWSRLGAAHKRKWLAVSATFPAMAPGEQARLHSRMAEWAALSPQQRTQARLNFAQTQALPADDKRAKWEAYQALPAEQKKKLAEGAGKPVPPTAAAVQPVSPRKLAAVRKPRPAASTVPASTAVISDTIDHHTLLPQPGTLPSSPP